MAYVAVKGGERAIDADRRRPGNATDSIRAAPPTVRALSVLDFRPLAARTDGQAREPDFHREALVRASTAETSHPQIRGRPR